MRLYTFIYVFDMRLYLKVVPEAHDWDRIHCLKQCAEAAARQRNTPRLGSFVKLGEKNPVGSSRST